MRIHLVSDLHTEFYNRTQVKKILTSIPNENVDVLVVAGDLSVGFNKRMKKDLRLLCDRFEHVVYVAGNHCMWHSTIEERYEQFANLDEQINNLHWLEKSSIKIDGQKFVGGTLWYAAGVFSPAVESWCDHVRVNPEESPLDTYREITAHHERTRKFFKENVDKETCVITHHLPSYECVSDRYRGDSFSCYFASDCEDIIVDNEPKFWLFAHSHSSMDLVLHNTRCVANAMGYPNESTVSYNPNLIIENVKNM